MKKLIATLTLAAFSTQALAGVTNVTTMPITGVDTAARKDIADMKKQLATLTGTVTTLATTVQAQTQTINNLAASVTTLRGQTAQLSQQVTDLAAAVAGMKKNLATEAQLAVLAAGIQDKVKTGTRNTAPAVYPQLPWQTITAPLMFRLVIIDDVPLIDAEVNQQLFFGATGPVGAQLLDLESGGALRGKTLYPQAFRVIPAVNDSAYEVKRYRIIGIIGTWPPDWSVAVGVQLGSQFSGVDLVAYPAPASLTVLPNGSGMPTYRCPLAVHAKATRTATSNVTVAVTTGWQCIGNTI